MCILPLSLGRLFVLLAWTQWNLHTWLLRYQNDYKSNPILSPGSVVGIYIVNVLFPPLTRVTALQLPFSIHDLAPMISSGLHGLLVGGAGGVFNILDQV